MFKILTNRILMQLALFILVSYAALSKPISSEEAKEIAMQHNLQMNKYSIELQDPSAYKLIASSHDIFSKATKNPTFYIYNFPQKGWVIVAGDDIARPVLAYSKDASYGLENLHDNAKYWLEVYDNAISEAIKQGVPQSEKIANEWLMARNPKKRTSLLDEVIPPLIKTKWGQESPYNNLCPYDEDEKKRTITGCVATTMAQIMKYWNFPVSGKGKYTYGHGLYGKLSADFGNTTYDWENMTNEYNQNSSKEEIKAVATLMYHCGVALSMHYGVESSGTEEHYIVSSLKTYFMYDNSIKLIHRSNYNNTWTDILKENLDNHQPMPYAGEANAIRHSFICDGYDTDGRFHFNLGWNGNSNGYYYIDGITNLELNLQQNVIVNIRPVNIKGLNSQVVLLKPLELEQEVVYQNSTVKINANIVNNRSESFSGSISLRLFDAKDNFVITIAEQKIDDLEPNKPTEVAFETVPLFNISAGKYYIKLYYKNDILNNWLLSFGDNKLVIDVKKTNTESKLSLYSLPTLSAYKIEKDSTLKVTASFINTSEEDFKGIISVSIYDEKGTMIKELASYNVTEAIAPNNYIKNIKFSNTISDLEHGTIYFIGFSSKEKSGEFALVNTNGFISFIKFEILPPELITDSQLKKWISDNKKQLFGVIVNEDGGITATTTNLEALAKIEYLNCHNRFSNLKLISINELIRHMPNLKTLECEYNALIELDVSNNIKLEKLDCSNNQLKNLDISKNIELAYLKCNNNQLTNLDVSKHIKLKELYCDRNQLNNLELIGNINLIKLDCSDNPLTNLNISNNIELKYLKCNNNQLINLDVNNNIKLEELHCFRNPLNKLDVTSNIELTQLGCFENQLTNLDVSKNLSIKSLHCYNNKLANLDISKNRKLEDLKCYSNQLTNLDVSKNIRLKTIFCNDNNLNNLDISPILNLWNGDWGLRCCKQAEGFILYLTNEQKNKFTEKNYCNATLLLRSNELIKDLQLKNWIKSNTKQLPGVIVNADGGITCTTKNLEALAKIDSLNCTHFNLVSIDELIRHMPNLKTLICSNASLIELDVSENINLITLACYNNQISKLYLNKNIKLKELHCDNNKLINLDLSKNLELTYLKCNNNLLADLDVSNNVNLETLHCYDNQLNNLYLNKNIKLKELSFDNNKLTNLDLSKNLELTYLKCNNNQLTNLDVSKNIKLEKLLCYHNQLNTLDLSNNIELMYLRCHYNQLINLSISKNIKLKELSFDNNKLNELDINKNTNLELLYCKDNMLNCLDISPLQKLKGLNCCIQAKGFILYLTNEQKNKFNVANYCDAILKEKDGSICEVEWLDIYPNPTAGKFVIDNKFFTDEIKILNLAGEILYRKTLNADKTEIDISNLPAGVYLVITKGKIGKVVKN